MTKLVSRIAYLRAIGKNYFKLVATTRWQEFDVYKSALFLLTVSKLRCIISALTPTEEYLNQPFKPHCSAFSFAWPMCLTWIPSSMVIIRQWVATFYSHNMHRFTPFRSTANRTSMMNGLSSSSCRTAIFRALSMYGISSFFSLRVVFGALACICRQQSIANRALLTSSDIRGFNGFSADLSPEYGISSYYSDSFLPDSAVNKSPSPGTVTDISCFESGLCEDFNFLPRFIPFTEDIQPSSMTAESSTSSNLKFNYDHDSNLHPIKEKTHFYSSSDLIWDRRTHAKLLLASFSGPNLCPWKACTSRAKFASRKFLNVHLHNIHVVPLVCEVTGCGYQKPFRNKHDLERHRRTAHESVKEWACPYERCRGEGMGFARKDKLLVHFRDMHGSEGGNKEEEGKRCPISHCREVFEKVMEEIGKENGKERMVEHVKRDHGNFECALGRCAGEFKQMKIISLFSDQGLEKHLQRDYGINGSEAVRFVSSVRKTRDKTLNRTNVGGGCKWIGCKRCGC